MHVERMAKMRNSYTIVVRKCEGKIPLTERRYMSTRRKDIIKIHI
jgi:hypothetical protein